MTEEKKEETIEESKPKLLASLIGQYTVIKDQKVYQFLFAQENTLEENLAVVKVIEDILVGAIEKRKAEAEEAKEEACTATVEE